jgi:hypothetical protein
MERSQAPGRLRCARSDRSTRLLSAVVRTLALVALLDGRAGAQDPSAPLGELRIEGQYIHKISLEGDRTEDLVDPCGTVKVPVGAYVVGPVELKGGFVTTSRLPGDGFGKIVVTEDTPGVLKVGGPLRQEITARRQGRLLVLSYRCVGIGGENYRNILPGRAPRFTVMKGGKAVGSGHFEYG